MSKKHKKQQMQAGAPLSQPAGLQHQSEYSIIKFDLIKVVILNAVYLIAILALYFANQKSQFLDNWFAKILHF